MIVVRFKGRCRPETTEQAVTALREIIAATRSLDGVVSFDIGQDLSDPDSFIATEVWTDRAALERQELLPQVKEANAIFDELLAAPPEMTIYSVSSFETM